MKKIMAALGALVFSAGILSAQMLDSSGVQNTLWTGFGVPMGQVNDGDRARFRFYGLIETLQVRLDVGKFTVEGMLNWGALTDWDGNQFAAFRFANTEITPFYYTNYTDQGGWWTNGETKSYYVNFLFHPMKGFDLGMGTRLNWRIGPAPASLANYWEPLAHIVQGGLKDAVPGNADVSGYTYYANRYTSYYHGNTNAALGARYVYNDFLEVGIAIPNGVTTAAPLFNAAFRIHPVDVFEASFAYEGIIQGDGNLYTGLSLFLKNFTLDAYLAVDNIGGNDNDGRIGTGAAITWQIPKVAIVIRPEAGFTFWENVNYTPAFYFGGRLDFTISSQFVLGAWTSCALGSADRYWYDDRNPAKGTTKSYTGGFVFDIRPDFSVIINKNHSISVFVDYQNRVKYDNTVRDTWASGIFWTYRS